MWDGSYRHLSGDTLRYRHAEPGHQVEHRTGDPGLGFLGGQSPGAKASTDDGLVAEHGGFPERALAVADRLLPSQASLVLDHPDVLVALTGRRVALLHGSGRWRCRLGRRRRIAPSLIPGSPPCRPSRTQTVATPLPSRTPQC